MIRVLVTGASGFIGRALCRTLVPAGFQVRAAVRSRGVGAAVPVEEVLVGDLGPATAWAESLRGVEAVVHLAARVHVLREIAADPLQAFRVPNVLGTERLARSCAEAGVRRLVLLSSIKVNGEVTRDRPYTEQDPPAPEDAYAISKAEAESRLHEVAGGTGLEVVVIRPCLVYGPEVGGNVRLLLRALDRGVPLPLGAVRNRRSLMGLDNLCDLLRSSITHPRAAGETFLASDGRDLSTPELIRALAAGLGRPARLIPVPVRVLKLAAKVSGQMPALQRLSGSLQVDSGKAKRVLDWMAPVPPEIGLRRTGEWYRDQRP